jgi:hypothetical protein
MRHRSPFGKGTPVEWDGKSLLTHSLTPYFRDLDQIFPLPYCIREGLGMGKKKLRQSRPCPKGIHVPSHRDPFGKGTPAERDGKNFSRITEHIHAYFVEGGSPCEFIGLAVK